MPHSERGITDYARLLFAAKIDKTILCVPSLHMQLEWLSVAIMLGAGMAEVSPLAIFGGLGGFASFDTANNTPVNGADNINEVADCNHPSAL